MSGSSKTYRVLASDFSADEEDAIEYGANAWDAGSGEINRGADWDFIRGSDVTNWTHSNGRFDVAMEDDSWFVNEGYTDDDIAVAMRGFFLCTRGETDIIFREDINGDPIDWTNDLPSNMAAGDTSMTYTGMHEFGHALGFQHEDDYLSVMDSIAPGGGDVGNRVRINEDDYVGLTVAKSDSSTGRNLALSRFRRAYAGYADEVWDTYGETGKTWSAWKGGCVSGAEPNDILALSMSTSTSYNVDVEWTLSSDTTCFDGDDISFDTIHYHLSSDTPYSIGPEWCFSSSTPPGLYYVCAGIDQENDFGETSEVDNVIRSEKLFWIMGRE